ncbi:MAG: aroK [Evtepia sp.]|jgi:shikimate kinase|nr:aroK [Evtepia sp.]
MKPNLILIGMPASGKSTLGQLLAERLGSFFLDTDDVLQAQLGEPLQETINREGISAFLEKEESAILSLHPEETVIATGGSVVYSETAMAHLKSLGLCIFLSVPFASIEARLQNLEVRGVAIPKGTTLLELYRERTPLYTRHADFIFREYDRNGDPSIAEHVEQLIALLVQEQHLKPSLSFAKIP